MDSTFLEKLAERKKERAEIDARPMDTIPESHEYQLMAAGKKLNAVFAINSSRRSKIAKIQIIMSEFREKDASDIACKKGCSNCCYQQVSLSQTEAEAIGKNIGRRPVQLRTEYKMPHYNTYGRETPCTFLVKGTCSIYAHRPFMCRNYVNVDRDNLLCSFENWDLGKANDLRCVYVPILPASILGEAYDCINGSDIRGDIRDFFPLKNAAQ